MTVSEVLPYLASTGVEDILTGDCCRSLGVRYKVVVTGCRAELVSGGWRYCVRGTSGTKDMLGKEQLHWL